MKLLGQYYDLLTNFDFKKASLGSALSANRKLLGLSQLCGRYFRCDQASKALGWSLARC